LMCLNRDSHRFFIVLRLIERLLATTYWQFAPTLLKGSNHARRHSDSPRPCLLRAVDRLRLRLRPALTRDSAKLVLDHDRGWEPVFGKDHADGFKETSMIFDYALAGLVTAGLLFYLTYALLRPEKF
jgi:K+-transporting ATPase KdpF subunit